MIEDGAGRGVGPCDERYRVGRGAWRRNTSTASARSTRASSTRRATTRTCTSAASRSSRARRRRTASCVGHIRGAAAPRPALPPEARRAAARPRPLALDRRPDVQPRVPRPPHRRCRAPGDEAKLRALAARIFSQRLDRTKPLWELWLVEDLDDGRWALISKTPPLARRRRLGRRPHDDALRPRPRSRATPAASRWQPRPEPSTAQLTATRAQRRACGALAELPLRAAAERARGPARRSTGRARRSRRSARSRGPALNPPPDTPLNVKVGPHRRFAVVEATLDDFKAVKNAFGGTVNDVVLAVVAGALRRWLHARGMRTEGLELRACVPVSVRTDDERGAFGNKLVQVALPAAGLRARPDRPAALRRRADAATSRTPSRRSAPRSSRARRTSRRRRSSPRRRG